MDKFYKGVGWSGSSAQSFICHAMFLVSFFVFFVRVCVTGSGLEWLFGSKWQWFAAAHGEGILELCMDGSLKCPSAGRHAHWWTDEQGRINMEWGNRLGLSSCLSPSLFLPPSFSLPLSPPLFLLPS